MILCLTPNPAVDRTLSVRSVQLGEVHRAEKVLTAAGGKGLNVARTIRTLGDDPLCMGPVGGHTGKLLAELATQEGLQAHWTQVQNETRTCMILVQEDQDATVINEPGQEITAHECDTLISDVYNTSLQADLVCVCGSLPPGFSMEQYKTLLTRLISLGKQVWVDTSGDALKAALEVQGACVKVNAAELGAATGLKIVTREDVSKAMRALREHGISQVVVTLGKDGALLCSQEGTWMAQPPRIEIVSSVGSGDAFLGGLASAFANGKSPEFALRHAVAAGAANALHFGGGIFSRRIFDEVRENVKITAPG